MKVELHNISHTYKGASAPSLTDLSIEIKKGTKHGVFGANGAGKSTLMKVICKVITPTAGSVSFHLNYEKVDHKNTVKQKIGYVPQDFAFYAELNIFQNALYFGTMFNLEREVIRERYHKLVKILGLENHLKKKVKTFSGGMKRKVNLILALLHNPELLILDEPTVGIDVHSKYDILNHLNSMHENGTTIIYTSHQMNESQSFCESFTLLDKGKNLITGNLDEVLKHQGTKDLESILLKA